MRKIAQHIDDGYGTCTCKALDNPMFENSGSDQAVIARHNSRHIFNWLAGIETDFFATGINRMSTELHDSDLHAVSRSIGWLFKNQRGADRRTIA